MAHPAATAASASFAFTSTITTCVSGSGGSRTTIEPFVVIAHPAGTTKVAPAGVALGVSFSTRPEAEDWPAAGSARSIDKGRARRAARSMQTSFWDSLFRTLQRRGATRSSTPPPRALPLVADAFLPS